MSKSGKIKRIIFTILTLLTIGVFAVFYVALKKNCEDLIKQKFIAEEELKDEQTEKNNLTAEYQNLTSEDRIMSIALNELDMVIQDTPIQTVSIDSKTIAEVESYLKERHD